MTKNDLEITEKQIDYSDNMILNEIVFDMTIEFNKNKDVYTSESYSKLYDLAQKVLKEIAPGELRIDHATYILNQFILEVEDLFKYCDGCEQYISADSEWSDNDFITSGDEYNICQECVINGYGT